MDPSFSGGVYGQARSTRGTAAGAGAALCMGHDGCGCLAGVIDVCWE